MKMEFDLESQLAESVLQAGQSLDWLGLRARFAAGYAARTVLNCAPRRELPVDGGSFDRGCARTLARYGSGYGSELWAVNPNALANGNSGCDKHAGVTGNVADD